MFERTESFLDCATCLDALLIAQSVYFVGTQTCEITQGAFSQGQGFLDTRDLSVLAGRN